MKKQIGFFSLMMAIAFNFFTGGAMAMAVGVPILAGGFVINGAAIVANVAAQFSTAQQVSQPHFFVGLAKELWLAELMKKYRPDPAWLQEARDLTMYCENDVLNLADAGADPGIIINYDGTYDIPVAVDEDTPVSITLKTISTEQSQIKWNAQRTRAYSIMADKTERHFFAMQDGMLKLGAYGIAPLQNSANTPVISTSGAVVGGVKSIKIDDVIDLKTRFLNLDVDLDKGLILVLNPTHLAALQKEDKTLFKDFVEQAPGKSFNLLGLKTYITTVTPLYNNATGVRKAYGAVAAGTDTICSFIFVKNEAGYAKGTIAPFLRQADTTRQSDFVNFAHAYFAGSIRNTGIGAIYSGA